MLEPELEKAKKEIGDLAADMDDLLIYAQFPVTGKKFLEWKYGRAEVPASVKPITMDFVKKQDELVKKAKAGELVERKSVEAPAKSERARTFNVFVDDQFFSVDVDPTGDAPLVASAPRVAVAAAPVQAAAPRPAAAPAPAAAAPAPAADAHGTRLAAPMPGLIIKYLKNVGDAVTKGEAIVVLEAMKMENALVAPCDGVIKEIKFASGDTVAKGAALCVIG